ncbi:hypothetical protein JCM16496A_10590 [Bacteroides rodentium JCM 16496]
MKKTLTVNLGGTVFNIDDDAYRLLDNYLSNLKMHFRKEAGADEIVDDIERRISELFAEKLSAGLQVITIADVEEVIARMGKPEDMEAEGEEAGAGSTNAGGTNAGGGYGAGAWSSNTVYNTTRRRLYRNPDDKMLGGVISGSRIPGLGCHFASFVAACHPDLWGRDADTGLHRLLVGHTGSSYGSREVEHAR